MRVPFPLSRVNAGRRRRIHIGQKLVALLEHGARAAEAQVVADLVTPDVTAGDAR